MKRNELVIDGRLLKRGSVRYTPAGTPAMDLVIGHRSLQTEAGGSREARCELEAVALGDMALKLGAAKISRPLRIRGFLAQHRLGNRRLVLHVVDAEPIGEGGQGQNQEPRRTQ